MKINNSFSNSIPLAAIFISLFFMTEYYAQTNTTIGLSVGYGELNMKSVNKDLNDTYQILRSANIPSSSPTELEGGFFVDGNILFHLNKFVLGTGVNYIFSDGGLTHSDYTGSIEESYEVSTIEIMGIIGTDIPLSEIVFIALRGFAGYGIASANHIGRFNSFNYPQDNIDITNDVSGGYFAARIQGGLEFVIKPIALNFSIAYRIADAGVLKGEMTENGFNYSNRPIFDSRGGDIKFDYSGITFLAGLHFIL